jgi:hypothetical protein
VSDADAVVAATNRMALLVDRREWDVLKGLFSDSVEVDYTSLNGGDPTSMAAHDLVDGWRTMLDRLDGTQHLLAGHLVTLDGETARCVCNVLATHVLTDPNGTSLWVVGGRYEFVLDRTSNGWLIAALTLTTTWTTGNRPT